MIVFENSYLHERFSYDPETGLMTVKKTGRILTAGDQGYVSVNVVIDGKSRYARAHRIGWQMHYGVAPIGLLDHINMNRSDNRIVNLRECNESQNAANGQIWKTNTSGLRGVYWNKLSKRWVAIINIHGKRVYLGMFKDKEKAYEKYCLAATKHFGEFFDPAKGRREPLART